MAEMRRVYYLGKEPATDPRLAGVELVYLSQIDMPEELAATLLREPMYSELPAPPVPMSEIPEPKPIITWHEPEPGEELRALSGVSDSRAKWLSQYGIDTLADMASLAYSDMAALADEMPRVSLNQVENWQKQAEEHPGWQEIEGTLVDEPTE